MKFETYPLGTLCKRVTSGGTPKSTKPEYYGGDIPWLNTKEINFNRIYATERCISNLGLENSSAKWIIPPAVIVAMYGATAGKVATSHVPLTTNQACCNMEIDAEKADFRFIYYYLKWKYRELSSLANGGAQQNLSAQLIKEFPVMLPGLVIQRAVADILWKIDDKIELNQKINENLYEMVNAYYTQLFGRVASRMVTVGAYSDQIYSGGTPTTSNPAYWDGSYSWFSSGETRNRFVATTEKTITQSGVDNSSTKLAKKYDIVIASAGQGFTRGQTSILLLDTYVNQSVIVIHADRVALPYLFWNLANRYEELRAISDSSSIRGSLTTKMISAFEIPLATKEFINPKTDDVRKFSSACKEFKESYLVKIETELSLK